MIRTVIMLSHDKPIGGLAPCPCTTSKILKSFAPLNKIRRVLWASANKHYCFSIRFFTADGEKRVAKFLFLVQKMFEKAYVSHPLEKISQASFGRQWMRQNLRISCNKRLRWDSHNNTHQES